MYFKKTTTIFLATMLAFTPHTTVKSPLNETQNSSLSITPRWANAYNIYQELNFDNGNAYCTGIITGKSETTEIDALFILERKTGSTSWVVEKTWTKSVDGIYLSFYDSDSVSEGYTYRFTVNATVVRNGVTEVANVTLERTY